MEFQSTIQRETFHRAAAASQGKKEHQEVTLTPNQKMLEFFTC
jgi:hypothetical protein